MTDFGEWNPFEVMHGETPDIPTDGETVLISIETDNYRGVMADTYHQTRFGAYFECGYEIGGEITAWMPLPKRYQPDMELGNLLFGNSRGEYSVPRKWANKFSELIEKINPNDYYGYAPIDSPFKTDRGGYENDVFVLNPYYWGDDEDIEEEPNFIYKPTGYEICWYKYPMRDAWSNMDLTYDMFEEIVDMCIESVE